MSRPHLAPLQGLAVFACLLGTSCISDAVAVRVDALSQLSDPARVTYAVLPGEEGVHPTDLTFRELAGHLTRALEARGMRVVEDAEAADAAVFMSYGISDPLDNYYSYSVPTWGYIGAPNVIDPYRRRFDPVYVNETVVRSYTTYESFVSLAAWDTQLYRESGAEQQLWKVSLSTNEVSGDLRSIVPVMLAAGEQFLGGSTEKQIVVELSPGAPAVARIRGESEPSE